MTLIIYGLAIYGAVAIASSIIRGLRTEGSAVDKVKDSVVRMFPDPRS